MIGKALIKNDRAATALSLAKNGRDPRVYLARTCSCSAAAADSAFHNAPPCQIPGSVSDADCVEMPCVGGVASTRNDKDVRSQRAYLLYGFVNCIR